MSKLFCLSPGLRVLERQMQQPPGYRPRGYGICIIEGFVGAIRPIEE